MFYLVSQWCRISSGSIKYRREKTIFPLKWKIEAIFEWVTDTGKKLDCNSNGFLN